MADQKLRFRIRLIEPPTNYAFCLQRGKGSKAERLDYIEVLDDEDRNIEFDLDVTVRPAKNCTKPDFFGPFAQGPSGARFFYLCVGNIVKDGDPRWSGRVKVPLTGLDWSEIDAATQPGHFISGRYQASRPDGRPVLASIQLLDDGWTVEADAKDT